MKLIRDRIPEILSAVGGRPIVEVVPRQYYRRALFEKLAEECRELAQARGENVLEELADVYEVMRALAYEAGYEWDEVIQAADAKREERGGFECRYRLIGVE